MKKFELTITQIKNLLHSATGNVKNFVMNEDEFIKDWMIDNKVSPIKEGNTTPNQPVT